MPRKPAIYVNQILEWADAFKDRRGRWPRADDGVVKDGPGLTWCAVDQALIKGLRGLRGGQTLAKVLLAHRRKRHRNLLADLSVTQVLAWADAHHTRTGEWPKDTSGVIPEAPGETWRAIHKTLIKGTRGLPGGSTLPQFLETHRGVPNHLAVPRLTIESVLGWADAHRARTNRWPTSKSGAIPEAPGERWSAVNAALIVGNRGLDGGSSLARLLAERRGVPNRAALPTLSAELIREWAVAHARRTGDWPRRLSGAIPESPGDTWFKVQQALERGLRGLPGGSSLPRLLRECIKEAAPIVNLG